MTGFTQQGGCSYNNKHAFYMKDYGAMPWLDCAKEASKRQLMMHVGYSQSSVWGYAVLNPSRTHAQNGRSGQYVQAAIGDSLSCQLSRDKDSLAPPPPLAQYCGDSGIFGNLLCAGGSLCDAGMNSANTQASNWNCCGVGNRAACMPGYIACNDLAGNGVDFSCHQSCASRGGNTCWLQADVDIGGVTVRWRYKDFGTQFHDQCMELASQAGASMTTPDTLGITWPSGTSYWIPSMMLCDLKSFMSASQSGTSNSYDSGSGYTRSTSTVSCLAAFIEVELAELPPQRCYAEGSMNTDCAAVTAMSHAGNINPADPGGTSTSFYPTSGDCYDFCASRGRSLGYVYNFGNQRPTGCWTHSPGSGSCYFNTALPGAAISHSAPICSVACVSTIVRVSASYPQNQYVGFYCPAGKSYIRHACGTNAEASLSSSTSASYGPFNTNELLQSGGHCGCCCNCNEVWVECQ